MPDFLSSRLDLCMCDAVIDVCVRLLMQIDLDKHLIKAGGEKWHHLDCNSIFMGIRAPSKLNLGHQVKLHSRSIATVIEVK